MKIEEDRMVTIHYEVKLDSGEVIDSSEGREPLTFVYGQGQIIPGLERQMEGMQTGDTKEIVVEPEEAYGAVNLEAIQPIPLDQFPEDLTLEKGMRMVMRDQTGQDVHFKIVDLTESDAIADFNHPLAGKTLHFSVKIIDVQNAT